MFFAFTHGDVNFEAAEIRVPHNGETFRQIWIYICKSVRGVILAQAVTDEQISAMPVVVYSHTCSVESELKLRCGLFRQVRKQ